MSTTKSIDYISFLLDKENSQPFQDMYLSHSYVLLFNMHVTRNGIIIKLGMI